MSSLPVLGFYLLLAFFCGVVVVTQPGANATLSRNVGGALNAATLSLCISAVAILILRIFFAPRFSIAVALDKTPYWGWLGGFLGVFYVTASLYAAPRIGATVLISLFLCGQIVAALVYDKFGLFGYGQSPITPLRLLGVGLIVLGTGLVLVKQ
jgi:bacterial/archaeal transporter family-2 protein